MISLIRQRLLSQSGTNINVARTFLTNQQIGIDRFMANKDRQTINKDVLITNIKSSLSGDGFVYTEDLKNLALAVDTPQESQLLKEAFLKFATSENSIRLDQFKIGPVVSRAFYHADDLKSLKELFEHEKASAHLKLRSAYNVYLSLLYKKECYEDVLNVAEEMFEKLGDGLTNSDQLRRGADMDNALIVYLAAANKISSKEILDRARKTLHNFKEKVLGKSDARLRMKHIMLYHLLCVKNNELAEALEVLSALSTKHYEFLNAKAAILIKLGRAEECLEAINKILEPDNNKAKYIFTETIETIKKELEKKS